MIVKNRRRVDFYTHVVANTPEDSSSRRRIWRYSERSFPSMRTALFWVIFTSDRRSRGRRGDLLKLRNINWRQTSGKIYLHNIKGGPQGSSLDQGSMFCIVRQSDLRIGVLYSSQQLISFPIAASPYDNSSTYCTPLFWFSKPALLATSGL